MEHGGSPGEFLERMRRYMPPVQRGLIAWVSSHPGLRGAAEIRGLGERYNECVRALAELRTQHLVLVSRYITSQVRIRRMDTMCHKYLTKFQANADKDRVKHLTRQGTGGTPLSTFLKTVRTDTTNKMFS